MEIELKVKGYKCERCSHEWQPRKKEVPLTCPKCKTPYWNRKKKGKNTTKHKKEAERGLNRQ